MLSMKCVVSGLCFHLLFLTLSVPASAQTPPEINRAKAIALQVCVAMQEQAERQQREGKPAPSLVRVFAAQAGLSAAETETLDRVTATLRNRVTPLDLRARAIIQAARAKYPGGRLPQGVTPPEPPAELAELQRQREADVGAAVQELDRELGPAGRNKFQEYMERTFLKQIKSFPVQTPLDIGLPGNPAGSHSSKRRGTQ